MLARLEHLEKDTHEHIHEEENILFARVRPGGADR
jgi:iron-sulfur cluster repair protein YtfE (RIC family)